MAKLTDEICSEFLKLKKVIKKAEVKVDDIRGICLEHGDWMGKKYVVTVEEQDRRNLSAELVAKYLSVPESELDKLGLYAISHSKKVTIKERTK